MIGISSILVLTSWFVLTGRIGVPSTSSAVARPAQADGIEAKARRWLTEPGALQSFLVARHQLDRRSGFRKESRESLEATIARAPRFAEAHAMLGVAYLRQGLYDPSPRAEAGPKAEAAARHALSLDPDLAAAHTVLSRILLLRDWNWTAAASEIGRAIELDPSAPDARSAYALYLRSTGRVAEAILQQQMAHDANPLNPQWLVFLGDEYQFARRFQDALHAYERALLLERDYRPAVSSLADVYPRLGRHDDGVSWYVRRLTLRGEKDVAAALEDVRQREGAQAALRWLDRRQIDQFRLAPEEHLWDLAYLNARLGNHDAALRFLQRAYDRRDPGMLQARVDPDLDSLRGDRRFKDLIERIGPH
jgi:tetratricopeptide (TPR) repeat protein